MNLEIEYLSLGGLLESKVRTSPRCEFVISPGTKSRRFTYGELRYHVQRASEFLWHWAELRKGDSINLIMHNSLEFVIAYFAALMQGIVVVPINPDLAPEEMLYIVKDSGSKAIFYDDALEHKVKAFAPGGLFLASCFRLISTDRLPVYLPAPDVGLDDEAVVIYTSGTSGKPKGAILTHGNLLADAKAIADWFKFSETTRALCILPLFHNNGQVVTLLAPLYAGGSAVIVKGKASLASVWGLEEKYGITWTSVMPSILSILLSLPGERKGDTLEGIICGGQPLSRNVQDSFEQRFRVPIFEGYGLTETTSFACFNDYPAEARRRGSIGRPLPVNEMAVLGDGGKELGPGQEGEICIRGSNVTKGYLGLPEKNAEAFRGGWFHSGDYGHKDDDGYYYFGCRKDALIIKGGENIYPAELENVLYEHPGVAECAVVGIPDELLGEDICAFIVPKDGDTTADNLRKFCQGRIAKFKQAKDIVFVDKLPKGPTKKVLYRKLREYYVDSCGRGPDRD